MKITRRQLGKLINERVVGGLDKSTVSLPEQNIGLTFSTWREMYQYLKDNDASIPYLCFIYYIGGLSNGNDFNFFEEYSGHKDIEVYKQALIELVSSAFTNPATSFLSYAGELHATITGNTYSVGYDFVSVFLTLVQNYFGDNLTPEEQVMMTIGRAGAGGTAIEKGTKYALRHPKHSNGNLIFKDAYDFTRFDFVARLGQDFLTSPHKVIENSNPVIFDNIYAISNVSIPEPQTVATAQSIIDRMEDEYEAFPGGKIFEDKTMRLTRTQLRKLILKEFRETGRYDHFDFGAGAGGGQLPPVKPPRRGGGGGGEEPRDFGGRSNDPCGFGNPKGDYYYDLVFNSFGRWVEDNMQFGGPNAFDNYIEYMKSLDPEFTMDLLSERYNEFFELLMTAIAEYACKKNIRDIESIYMDPIPAILFY